jgi:hypothetical protein
MYVFPVAVQVFHTRIESCRALANITNDARKAQAAGGSKDAGAKLEKPAEQAERSTAATAPSQPPQKQRLPSYPGSPERLMGMSGEEIERQEAAEEHARCLAHADYLASIFKASARVSDGWSDVSEDELSTTRAQPDDNVSSTLPDVASPEHDELPDLPDWFWPLTFELGE